MINRPSHSFWTFRPSNEQKYHFFHNATLFLLERNRTLFYSAITILSCIIPALVIADYAINMNFDNKNVSDFFTTFFYPNFCFNVAFVRDTDPI